MTCQQCIHWSPKKAGQMGRHGFGICEKGKTWEYLAPQHTCPKQKEAAQDVVNARAVWLSRLSNPQK